MGLTHFYNISNKNTLAYNKYNNFAFQSTFKTIIMTKQNNPLDQLAEIREMMSKSSKFISLSGFSGIWVGTMALLGMAAVFYFFPDYFLNRYLYTKVNYPDYLLLGDPLINFLKFVVFDAALVLIFAIGGALFFTYRKTTKQGGDLWNESTKRFLVSFLVPLTSGGAFILIIIYQGMFAFAGPLSLIFYGLALFNAGRYSLIEIRYLGLLDIGLGLLATLFLGYTALFWGLGFGILHIIYGIHMYIKYDRKQ